MNKIKSALTAAISFGEGHRTQLACAAYAMVEGLHVTGLVSGTVTIRLEAILLPLAGAAFAAKISRIGSILAAATASQNTPASK